MPFDPDTDPPTNPGTRSRRLAVVDARVAVIQALDRAGSLLSRRAIVINELPERPVLVRATESLLIQQVLDRLVEVAQAIPEGDIGRNRISVRVRAGRDQVTITVSGNDTAGAARIVLPLLGETPVTPQVLVVDDDLLVCRAVLRVLRSVGYRVICATDVATALEMIAEAPPAMMLTDHRLGADTGLGLVMAVRARWPELPVVLMSGALSGDIEGVAQLLRIRVCLPKPVSLTRLVEVVHHTIGASTRVPG